MMSDIVDQAQDAEALFIDLARKSIALATPVLPARGTCYNCKDDVPYDLRFCDSFCRDDFALRKASEARRGIVRHG
jgi:hypothetical protein